MVASTQSDIHAAIAELLRTLHGDDGCGPTSRWRHVAAAALHLPRVDHASIMVVGPTGMVRPLASTHPDSLSLDRIQRGLAEGPGVDAACERQVTRVDDLACERGWPRFVNEAAANTSIRSVLSLPLLSRDFAKVALTLHAERPGAFGAEAEATGLRFVTSAAMAVETWLREQRYRKALFNRDIIGEAKGILMERFHVDAVTAFSLLAELSKNRGESVSSAARALVRRKLDGDSSGRDSQRPDLVVTDPGQLLARN